jgi:adenylate cyclase
VTDADSRSNDELWRALLTGEDPYFTSGRRRYRRIPGAPRCKTCQVPLGGVGGRVVRLLSGIERARKNPNFCNICDQFVEAHPGGAEIPLSLLFADVRGSTTLAEALPATDFTSLMNRFYGEANRVLIDSDAIVDKLVGDEVIGLYLPAITPDHARRAILAARDLLRDTAHADGDGSSIQVGAGVHTGTAWVGAIGSADTVADFTALGDAVNVTARLASTAGPGELLVSDEAFAASGLHLGPLERRRLELRGRGAPVGVHVVRVAEPDARGARVLPGPF